MAVSKAVKLLDRILDAGYPEGTAKKIASGELSMDEASRISRASEQATDTNRELYHWTNREFNEFQPSSGGKFGQGVYLSPRPYYGEKYVERGDPLRMSVFGPSNIAKREDIGSVESAVLNEMKTLGVPPMAMGDTFWNLTQQKLKEKGFDALEFGDEVVVFDPARVRDVRAAFDPDNKGLKNILGGSAALAVGLGASNESEAGVPDAAAKAVNKAINVRVDKKAGIDYADEILSGKKTFETRNTDSLRPYVGQRVGIARTGAGEAKALGSAEIGEPIVVDEATFRTMQDQHLVPPGTDFDIKPGGTKYLYPVSNPERFDTPKDVGKGIVARKILGGGAATAFGLGASDDSQAADAQPRITPEFASRMFDRIVSDNPGREKNAYIPVKPTTMDYVQNAGRAIVDYFGTDAGKDMLGGLGQEIAVEGALGSLGQMIFGPAGAVGGAALLPNVAGDPTMDMLNDQGQPMTEAEFAAYRRQLRGN